MSKIQLNWSKIHHTSSPGLSELLSKYDEIFQEGLGTLKGYEAKIEVDPEATPRFCKARTLPYSMRHRVEEELNRLVTEGTLEPVDYSDWAAPIVAVVKSDQKSVRVCGDFRMTVNPVSKLNRYPIPKVEDLFATLERGKTFTKLDLSHDILITGETESDHLQSLEEVLNRLVKAGLRVKKHKCKFMAPSVTYLGYVIDAEGLHPLPDKVQAVQQAPTPRSVTELKSYLGLLTYYGKFLPNLSTRLAPLYKLLGKNVKWKWS